MLKVSQVTRALGWTRGPASLPVTVLGGHVGADPVLSKKVHYVIQTLCFYQVVCRSPSSGGTSALTQVSGAAATCLSSPYRCSRSGAPAGEENNRVPFTSQRTVCCPRQSKAQRDHR